MLSAKRHRGNDVPRAVAAGLDLADAGTAAGRREGVANRLDVENGSEVPKKSGWVTLVMSSVVRYAAVAGRVELAGEHDRDVGDVAGLDTVSLEPPTSWMKTWIV